MIVKRHKIPEMSMLKHEEPSFQYIDSFESPYLSVGAGFDLVRIGKMFLSGGPKWADTLMSIRDKAVGIFGLKTSNLLTAEEKNPNHFKFIPGEQLDIFKLFDRTENELIMGGDDKHLNLKVSLLIDAQNHGSDKKKIIITTAVHFNHVFGRLYFLPVKPFHQMIVKKTLQNMIREIEQENTSQNQKSL